MNIVFENVPFAWNSSWKENPQRTILIVSVLMISVHLRAHKLEFQVMNTANTTLLHMLLKTQWAVMRELKRGSLKNLYIFYFPLVFIINNYSKEISCQRKVAVNNLGAGTISRNKNIFYWCCKYCPNR